MTDLTITGASTAGTYRITLNGAQTAAIAHSANTSAILAALRDLPTIYRSNEASPTTGVATVTQITNTSSLRVYRITFTPSPQGRTTPIATVDGSLVVGATVTLSPPAAPLMQSIGNARRGRLKIATSGIAVPGTVVAAIKKFWTQTYGLPPHANDPIFRGYSDTELRTYEMRGSMPSEVYVDHGHGFSMNSAPVERVNYLLSPDARMGDETPDVLARLPCWSSSLDGFRQTYLGEQLAFEPRDQIWPYAIPRTPGIEPMAVKVRHLVLSQAGSGFSDGYVTVWAESVAYYSREQIYPTHINPGSIPLDCNQFAVAILTTVLLFHAPTGETYNGEYPCGRAVWTLPNTLTLGEWSSDATYSHDFAAADGGSVTITAEETPVFGDDETDEFQLDMEVGEPRAYFADFGIIDYGPPSAIGMEPVSIRLRRHLTPNSGFDVDASNNHIDHIGYTPAWYGESAGGLYRARVDALVSSGENSASAYAQLVVERQEPWPNGAGGGRRLVFRAPIHAAEEFAVPENSEEIPRYRLTSARPRGTICGTLHESSTPLYPDAVFNEGFCFTQPALVRQGTPYTPPVRVGRTDGPCATSYLVAWKEDGSSVQVLDAAASPPEGYRSLVVTREACYCYFAWFVLCPHRYSNETAGKDGVRITLYPIGYAGAAFTVPPSWGILIVQNCPRSTFFRSKGSAPMSECPPSGEYDQWGCTQIESTRCNDCADETCDDHASSFRVIVRPTESAVEAYLMNNPEAEYPAAMIWTVTRTEGCAWAAASPTDPGFAVGRSLRATFVREFAGVEWVYTFRVYEIGLGPPDEEDNPTDLLVYESNQACTYSIFPDEYMSLDSVGPQTLFPDYELESYTST